ncbi:MAG: hypothetical protein OZ922_05985 [Myxococcales bacterium]|nr:hypothetical protein [Myxococcales bacterium]
MGFGNRVCTLLDRFRQDLVYAARGLLKQPAFALGVIATLALDIDRHSSWAYAHI